MELGKLGRPKEYKEDIFLKSIYFTKTNKEYIDTHRKALSYSKYINKLLDKVRCKE